MNPFKFNKSELINLSNYSKMIFLGGNIYRKISYLPSYFPLKKIIEKLIKIAMMEKITKIRI